MRLVALVAEREKLTRTTVSVLALLLAQVAADGGLSADIAQLDLEGLLDTPIASVSRREESSAEAPAAVFVLTADDIKAQGFRSLDEVLRSVPGLFQVDDTLYEAVGVRGIQVLGDMNTRILVLIDGHPLNNSVGVGQWYTGRDLPVDVGAIERVEVIKGPAGGVYGPFAYFGAINVVTKGAARNGGEVQASGEQSQGRANGYEAALRYGRDVGPVKLSFDVDFYRSRGFDYAYPELQGLDRPVPEGGKVGDVDYRSVLTAYGTLVWRDFTLRAAYGERLKGLPTAPYSAIVGDPRTQLFNRTAYVQLSWERQVLEVLGLYARLGYDSFRYEDTIAYPDPPDDLGPFHDLGLDQWVSGEIRATATPFAGHRDTVGVEVQGHFTQQNSKYVALPSAAEDPVNGFGVGDIRKNFATVNAYLLVDQKLFDQLALQAGLTFYAHAFYGSRFTPKASAVWSPTKNDVVKVLYSEGFRAPTMYESFFEDGLDFLPNAGLKPETARSIEGSYERRLAGVLSLSAAVFHNAYENLIVSRTVPAPDLGREPDPSSPSDYRQKFFNAAHMAVTGGEFGFNLAVPRWVRAYGGVSVQAPMETGPDVPTANFARVTGNFAVSTRAIHPSLSLAVNGAVVGPREKDPATVRAEGDRASVDPYLWLDASIRWELPWVKGLAVQVMAYNLLDSPATEPLVGDHYPLSEVRKGRREFRARLEWAF